MKIHKYRNYNEYIKSQKRGYKQKKNHVWACEENIKFIVEYLKPRNPQRGLCHGVRTGQEIIWFSMNIPKCNIIGTDVGTPQHPFIIQHDFNTRRDEWLRAFDFIYSNSFDHSYDPKKTLKIWAEQVRTGGVIILEWSKKHEHTGEISKAKNAMDPVSVSADELVKLIPTWAEYLHVIDVLDMPVVKKGYQKAIVIEVK